jgi:peptidyl-prolyl cis-trans isomerase C
LRVAIRGSALIKEFSVRRVLPFVVALALSACSKTPAGETKSGTATTATPVTAAAAVPPKPVPAQLPTVIAKVNGEAINKADFEQAVNQAEQQAGSPVPADQRDRVFRDILDQMIGFKLLEQEVKSRKVPVPDADVEAQLAQMKQQFPSEDAFKTALISQGMSLEQLKTEARQRLAISKLIEGEVAPKVSVKPEAVDAFYKENPDKFQQGEQVHASHILITAAKDADVATKAKARAKAESLLKQARAGQDFAALAKANSQDPGSAPNGGDLGFFAPGQMVPQFNDVAFALKPGAISDVVETDFGYHIIKVLEKKAGRTVPIDEARGRIQQFLEGQNREKETENFVKSLRSKGKVEVFI